MAKSIRSKRKRKLRAIKRVRYGAKELERLKKTLSNDTTTIKKDIDEVMTDVSEVVTVSDAKTVREKSKANTTDGESTNKKINPGSYPVWMHPRKIRKMAQARKKAKNKKKNKK